eukprot:292520-Rhodomonas_salina.1
MRGSWRAGGKRRSWTSLRTAVYVPPRCIACDPDGVSERARGDGNNRHAKGGQGSCLHSGVPCGKFHDEQHGDVPSPALLSRLRRHKICRSGSNVTEHR